MFAVNLASCSQEISATAASLAKRGAPNTKKVEEGPALAGGSPRSRRPHFARLANAKAPAPFLTFS
eukprot:364733-Chlamydomonas_euryale.AAC.7